MARGSYYDEGTGEETYPDYPEGATEAPPAPWTKPEGFTMTVREALAKYPNSTWARDMNDGRIQHPYGLDDFFNPQTGQITNQSGNTWGVPIEQLNVGPEMGRPGSPGGGGGASFGAPAGGSDDDGRVGAIIDNIPPSFYDAPDPFSYPDFAAPSFDTPEFNAPDPFSYPEFALPTGQEVLNEDPGYGLRAQQGEQALKNNASARGILRSGATAKSLMDYGQGLASQEYGNAVDRRFNTWSANRNAKASDYDTLWRNLLTDYGVKYGAETDEYNRANQTYQTNFGKAATGYGFGLDVAAGKAGGRQGATSLAGNLSLGAGAQAQNKTNSLFDQILSLYNATRPAPYQPSYAGSFGA